MLDIYPFIHASIPQSSVLTSAIDGGWEGKVLTELSIDFCDIDVHDGSLTAVKFFKDYYSKVCYCDVM